MKFNLLLGLVYVFSVFFFCRKSDNEGSPFNEKPDAVELKVQSVTEASGIADSYIHPGNCWIQEDSGNPPELILLGHDGSIRKKVAVAGAINRDWEDISVAQISGVSQIYIGDFGDNLQIFNNYMIYRFPEPNTNIDTVRTFDRIRFTYPDKAHDAEAMIVDPLTGDIYLITKRDVRSKVYKLTYPQLTDTVNKAVFVVELPYNQVVSASMSPDGREMIIKTYNTLYYYKRSATMMVAVALSKGFLKIPYTMEPQGEAVGFAKDGGGFFTISEKPGSEPVNLFFYKRK